MAHRPIETTSVRQSNYHAGYIRTSPESSWEVVAHNNNNNNNTENIAAETATATMNNNEDVVLPCTYLDLATNLNLPGKEQRMRQGFPVHNSLRWNREVPFHGRFRLPSVGGGAGGTMTASEKGIVVGFEGTPRFSMETSFIWNLFCVLLLTRQFNSSLIYACSFFFYFSTTKIKNSHGQ